MLDKSYRRTLHTTLKNYVPQGVIDDGNRKKNWKYGYNSSYDFVVISKDGTLGEIISINGLVIGLPKPPKQIRNQNLRDENQKWRRYKIPAELVNFDQYYKDEKNTDSIIVSVYEKYKDFIDEDYHRIEYGDWLMVDGKPIYLTGYFYFFLQHYKLTENIAYPDFRMTQRDYFIWLEACFADERCLGSLLLKNRRSAFSTGSSAIVIADAIRTKNGFYPIMSKKDKDASELFEKHIVQPFLELPKHLQPQRTGEVKPKKELYLSSPKKKLTTNNKNDASYEGLDTKITFYSTTLDSYDGTRVRFFSINDEIGKLNFDVNEWWNQSHKRCHVVGSKIVGKAICGSTANPPNGGGRNYEIFYNNSKLSTRNNSGRTRTGLYAIFISADLNTMGFFDEHGYAVVGNPSAPIKNELGELISIGSKQFLDDAEISCTNLKDLNFQKRNDPRVDVDAFLDEDATSMYGTEGLVNHKNYLKTFQDTDKYKMDVFRFDLHWKDGIADTDVVMVRNDNGRFWCSWMPPVEMRNKVKEVDGKFFPLNAELGAFGCDTYDSSKVRFNTGSKMGLKGITSDSQLKLVEHERNKMFIHYNHRPETKDEAEEDVIKCIRYFSMPILPELNKKSLAVKLKQRGYRGFVLNNPLKKKSELTPDERDFGGIISSNNGQGGGSIKAQQDALEAYINDNLPVKVDEDNLKVPFIEVLEDAEIYTPETRQQRDGTVAWMYAVLAVSRKIKRKETPTTETMIERDIMSLFNA